MNPYFLLAIAIVFEVTGSSLLKLTNGFKKWLPTVGMVAGMGISFYCMSLALTAIPLGTAYAIWSGAGTALTAAVGVMLYKESIHTKKVLGLVCIIAGVILMKLSGG